MPFSQGPTVQSQNSSTNFDKNNTQQSINKIIKKIEEPVTNKKHILSDSDSLSSSEDSESESLSSLDFKKKKDKNHR